MAVQVWSWSHSFNVGQVPQSIKILMADLVQIYCIGVFVSLYLTYGLHAQLFAVSQF